LNARRTTPREQDPGALLRRNRELATLRAIAETLNRSLSLREIAGDTLPLVVELLGLHTGWLFLRDESGDFIVAAVHNLPPAMAYPGPPWCQVCACQRLAQAGELRDAAQIVECSRLGGAAGDRQGLAFHASVPLAERGQLLGILNVATSAWDSFTPQDLQLLTAVGYQLATALNRAQLAEQATHLALAEERNRLAREVHDTLAQELTAITLQLETADALLDTAPERARERIRAALARTRESLAEARRSVLDLRAGPLERQALPDALAELARRFAAEAGLAVETRIAAGGARLPARHEQALYRIAQEALANIRRHARATAVTVELEIAGGRARLSIADDGRGFDTGALRIGEAGGFGLLSMQERARLLGGTLTVASAPGQGTRIDAAVPLQGAESETGGAPAPGYISPSDASR
jgi:two-component system NarL family sensor kinase